MRISDWSSDVCSSYLHTVRRRPATRSLPGRTKDRQFRRPCDLQQILYAESHRLLPHPDEFSCANLRQSEAVEAGTASDSARDGSMACGAPRRSRAERQAKRRAVKTRTGRVSGPREVGDEDRKVA